MKVLVTGALGNVGRYALEVLLKEGHQVAALELESQTTRKLAAGLDPAVKVIWGNITDPVSVRNALDGIEAVIHLAGIIPPNVDKNPELARRVNVGGTANLIGQMQESQSAKRLVFASSVGVFGDVQDGEPPLRVETPVSPADEYGRQKVECELAVRASGLQWTILRLGPAVPTRIIGGHNDPRMPFELSPKARIEIIHPADAGTAFARAVACDQAIDKLLYVGGGKSCQLIVERFINELMDSIGIGPIPTEAFAQTGSVRVPGDWMDTAESQRLLQYQQRTLQDLGADLQNSLGAPLVLLIRLLRPVATWCYVHSSPYLKENRRRVG